MILSMRASCAAKCGGQDEIRWRNGMFCLWKSQVASRKHQKWAAILIFQLYAGNTFMLAAGFIRPFNAVLLLSYIFDRFRFTSALDPFTPNAVSYLLRTFRPAASDSNKPLYNRASYFFSDNSATPGKVLPSNNSKEAPPPVETWLNSSSLPA